MSDIEEFDPAVCYDVILDGGPINENKYKALLSQNRACAINASMLPSHLVASFGPSRTIGFAVGGTINPFESIRNSLSYNSFPRRNGKTSSLGAWYNEYFTASDRGGKCWNAVKGIWENPVNPCVKLNAKYDKINPLNQKEHKMKLNIETLKELAAINTKDDLSNYSKLPEGLREAMAEIAKEDAKAKTKAAAIGIMSLLTAAEERIKTKVGAIRQHRKAVDLFRADITEIERARAYAEETNNFIPLGVLLGEVQVSPEEKNLAVVPADWKSLQI